LRNLKMLDLSRNQLSEEQKAKIKKELPPTTKIGLGFQRY